MRTILLAITLLAPGTPAFAAEPKTDGAVVATDRQWGEAEAAGDVQFLKNLLVPDYISVNVDGNRVTRAQLVQSAKARSRSPEDRAKRTAETAAWLASHPMRPEVARTGDTAVLKWVSAKPESDGKVLSCDIFVYRAGHWHAVYSQHTSA